MMPDGISPEQERDTAQPMLQGPGGATRLTPRQAQVLELAAHGLGDKEIATCLGISPRTVVDRFAELRERTGARTRVELVARATEAGLVQLVPDIPYRWPQRRLQNLTSAPSRGSVTSPEASRTEAGQPGQGQEPNTGKRPIPCTAHEPNYRTLPADPQLVVDHEPLSYVVDNVANDSARGQAASRPEPSAGDEPLASTQEVLGALHEVRDERDRLDDSERALIDMARRHGVTWPRIARALGVGSAQAAQQRRKRLGSPCGTESSARVPQPPGHRS